MAAQAGGTTCGDMELVQRACGGESEAFAELVARYQDYIYNAVIHLVNAAPDAEDIAQEVFLKAFRSMARFRQEAEFSTWIYGIMLNCVRSHWRLSRRRRLDVPLGDAPDGEGPGFEPASGEDGPLALTVRAERVAAVRSAIGRLDEELREVLVLRDIEGLSYQQLARAFDLPLGTVKSRLFRARNALKELIAPVLAAELDQETP